MGTKTTAHQRANDKLYENKKSFLGEIKLKLKKAGNKDPSAKEIAKVKKLRKRPSEGLGNPILEVMAIKNHDVHHNKTNREGDQK